MFSNRRELILPINSLKICTGFLDAPTLLRFAARGALWARREGDEMKLFGTTLSLALLLILSGSVAGAQGSNNELVTIRLEGSAKSDLAISASKEIQAGMIN